MKKVSCGVVITDLETVLLGHATKKTHWDIPKGCFDEGVDESFKACAMRELFEETGYVISNPDALIDMGRFRYNKEKDVHLFLYVVETSDLPDINTLRCESMVDIEGEELFPEIDEFNYFNWRASVNVVSRGLQGILPIIYDKHIRNGKTLYQLYKGGELNGE